MCRPQAVDVLHALGCRRPTPWLVSSGKIFFSEAVNNRCRPLKRTRFGPVPSSQYCRAGLYYDAPEGAELRRSATGSSIQNSTMVNPVSQDFRVCVRERSFAPLGL